MLGVINLPFPHLNSKLINQLESPPLFRLRLPTHTNNINHHLLRFSSISSLQSHPTLTSSLGSPPPFSPSNLTNRHILMLNLIACAVAISASWLFLSAIPALLAFRRAADSVAKLMDVMREELPHTMAAVRLSGMEISDLTMELTDLGQQITKGVRSSTQAVRVAQDTLRRFTPMPPNALLQEQACPHTDTLDPAVARAARGLRQGIVNGRSFLHIFFTLTRFSKMAFTYLAAPQNKP